MTKTKDSSIFMIFDRVFRIETFFDAHAFAHYHSAVFIFQSDKTKPNDNKILTRVFFSLFWCIRKFESIILSAELGIQSQIKFDGGTFTFSVLNPFMWILVLLVDKIK